jgi:hypothetical protein
VEISPTALDFGNVGVKMTRSLVVTVSYSGNTSAGWLFLKIVGPDAAQFRLPGWSDPYGGSEVKATMHVDVAFEPMAAGVANATLQMSWNQDSPRPQQNIPLSGYGTAPGIGSENTQCLDFGLMEPGNTKQLPLTISNTGDAELVLDKLSLKLNRYSPFWIFMNDDQGFELLPPLPSIPAGGNLPLQIEFTAQKAGTSSKDALVIESNAQNAPVYEVALSGGSLGPAIYLQTELINFGVLPVNSIPAHFDIEINSAGTTPLTIHSILFISTVETFSLGSVPTPLPVIPVDKSFRFQVIFTPITPGDYETWLEVKSNDPRCSQIRIRVKGICK